MACIVGLGTVATYHFGFGLVPQLFLSLIGFALLLAVRGHDPYIQNTMIQL